MNAKELLDKLIALLGQMPDADVVFEQENGYRHTIKEISWDSEIPAIVITITDQDEE